jgi:hypothetical protein
MIDSDERPHYVEQKCSSCGERYRVLPQEACWRHLCTLCFKARRSAPLRCAECGKEMERAEAVTGVCVQCLANEVIRHTARKEKPQRPELEPPQKRERPQLSNAANVAAF